MKKAFVVAVMCWALIFSGCATFLNWWNSNQNNVQLAVDIAVTSVVNIHPLDAAVLGTVAQTIITVYNQAESITADQLVTAVLAKLNAANLPPADIALATDLLKTLYDPNGSPTGPTGTLVGFFVQQGITDPLKMLVVPYDLANMVLHALGTPAMQSHIAAVRKAALKR